MNRRGFISVLAGAAGVAVAGWRFEKHRSIFLPLQMQGMQIFGDEGAFTPGATTYKLIREMQRLMNNFVGAEPREVRLNEKTWSKVAKEMTSTVPMYAADRPDIVGFKLLGMDIVPDPLVFDRDVWMLPKPDAVVRNTPIYWDASPIWVGQI